MGDYSPEKAGVGSSILPLATMFSTTYEPFLSTLGCVWLHLQPFPIPKSSSLNRACLLRESRQLGDRSPL